MILLCSIEVRERKSDTQEPAVEVRVRLESMDDSLGAVTEGGAVFLNERADLQERLRTEIWCSGTVNAPIYIFGLVSSCRFR